MAVDISLRGMARIRSLLFEILYQKIAGRVLRHDYSGIYARNLYSEDSRGASNLLDLDNILVNSGETETHTHIAAAATRGRVKRTARIAAELNENGDSPLHLASSMGQLELVVHQIRIDSNLCLAKDIFGRTPLHTAAMKGKLEVMKVLLNACPESLMQLTARSETPLHTAVLHNQVKALQLLVDWLKRTNNINLINSKDLCGNTVLHLAISRKQLRTVEILLGQDPTVRAVVEINAMNAGGFTALDILNVLPENGKMSMEINKVLRPAGALKAKDVTKLESHITNHEVAISFGDCRQPSYVDTTKSINYNAVLLTATLFATITFRAALCPPCATWEEDKTYKSDLINTFQLGKHNSTLTRCFIFFNSMGFFTSVAMILFLMHDLPWKPWLFISVSSLVGSYMCSIMEISPSEALALVALGSPLVLLAATPRLRGIGLKFLQWGCVKNLGSIIEGHKKVYVGP